MKTLRKISVLTGLALLALTATASAAITVGPPLTALTPNQNDVGGGQCAATFPCTYIEVSGPSPLLVAPVDGTVTSFTLKSGSSAPVALRVLRPSGTSYTGIGTGATETYSAAGAPQTFTTSLPVQAGDYIGLLNSTNALLFATVPGSQTGWFGTVSTTPAIPDGATAALSGTTANRSLALNATIEPSPATGGEGGGGGGGGGEANGGPSISIVVPKKQSKAAKGVIALSVGVSQQARVAVVASSRVGRGLNSTKEVDHSIAAAGTGKFKLRFSGKARRAIKAKLGAGGRLKVKITVTATNLAGIATTAKKTITVGRRLRH